MDKRAETEAGVIRWYDKLHSRRLDLVGDYAGRERFLIEGDSLLLQCFSDSKIDFEDGFQLLHAIYAIESFLHRLSRRNCIYHLAFFDQHRFLCVPPHCRVQDEPKYLLARSAIVRHLSYHLAQTNSSIQVLNFSSTKDEGYEEYLERAGIYFIMCHDGAQVPQQAKNLAPAEASIGDSLPTRNSTTKMIEFQLFILRSMLAGYNVALVNSLEWRDTKVFASVLEGFRDPHGRVTISQYLSAHKRRTREVKVKDGSEDEDGEVDEDEVEDEDKDKRRNENPGEGEDLAGDSDSSELYEELVNHFSSVQISKQDSSAEKTPDHRNDSHPGQEQPRLHEGPGSESDSDSSEFPDDYQEVFDHFSSSSGPKQSGLTERSFVSILSLTNVLRKDASQPHLAYSLLLHTVMLDHLPLSSRRFGMVDRTSQAHDVDEATAFFSIFIKAALVIINDARWVEAMNKMGAKCNVADLADGRLYHSATSAVTQGLTTDTLPTLIGEELQHLANLLHKLCGVVVAPQPRSGGRKMQSQSPNVKGTAAVEEQKPYSVLAFSNPVFDRHLNPIKISAKVLESAPQDNRPNRIFLELSHWHNSKRLMEHKSIPRPLKQDRWTRSRALRRDQIFVSEMTNYAASLTDTAGKGMKRSLITVTGPAPKVIKDRSAAKTNASRIATSGKKSSNSDKITPRQSIATARAAEETKERDRLLSVWKKKQEIIYAERDLEKTYVAAEAYLNELPDAKRRMIEGDIRLYKLNILLKIWAQASKDGKSNASHGVAALAWELLRQLATNTQGMSKTIVKYMTTVSTSLGLPFTMQVSPDEDRPLSFNFEMPAKTNAMALSQSPIEFILSQCGPFLDRSVDSAQDPRVSFNPDRWQRRVLDELDANRSVFVVAPTSAGKTFISFYAMEKVLREDDDGVLVYVAPTKALVNQIAAEIEARFSKNYKYPGKTIWAIHTRDLRINNSQSCQILVTVPHILQIMLLAPSNARSWSTRIRRIIFDEIHSIGQADDGVVWEQLLLLVPCPIVALSATVGNPEAFSSWLDSSQRTSGFEVTMIKHDQRYSDLRKFLFVPPRNFAFRGLPPSKSFAKLGLDDMPGFVFLHPVASLANKYRGVSDDFALEARDCLMLWQAMVKHQARQYPVDDDLSPGKALPAVPKRADIFSWERRLKELLRRWMTDNKSPFDKVLNELSSSIKSYSPEKVQISTEASKDGERPRRIDTDDLCETTLPLLTKLHEQGALPVILFNYDRNGCEKICKAVLEQLKSAELRWKESSPTWKARMAAWKKWKIVQEKQKSAKPSAVKKRAKGKDEDGEESVSKAEREKDTANEESSSWDSFDPNAPLEEFSFANKKKHDQKEMSQKRWQLERREVEPWLIEALSRGIGVHHAGMNRAYRHAVEIFFRKGFLRVVVATGTLALGINMPCKTVVFCGDSVFLTALNYRQGAGRAGRRGFDLLGNVVFLGISQAKVDRLLSSRLPDLNGHFPLTTSLVLRLCILLSESKNSTYAKKAIDSLLSQPRLYLGGESFKEQVLHHLRFSIEYLRRQHLLDANGNPLNFSGCIAHLYYTENSSFAFHALLKNGFFHNLSSAINSNGSAVIRELMIVMAHLFGRRPYRQFSQAFFDRVVKRSPSVAIMPAMPENAANILREHNKDTLDIFSTYVKTFIDEHLHNDDDCKLPLTAYEVRSQGEEELSGKFLRPLPPTKSRSAFVALSGHDDSFESISDLCNTVRGGVFLEEAVVPHLDFYPDELSAPLNAYLYDFYMHGDVTALEKANGIRRGEVWFLLNDFSMVLATIITSLENFLGSNAESDLEMLEIAGDGDALEMTIDEESLASTEITVPSVQSAEISQRSVRKPAPAKSKVVKESWDDDDEGDDIEAAAKSNDVLEGNFRPGRRQAQEPARTFSGDQGDRSSDAQSGLDTDGSGGISDVLAAFQRLRKEFDEKFRAMWA